MSPNARASTGDDLFDARKYERASLIDPAPLTLSESLGPDDVREFGGWTLDKLDVFDLYLKNYRRVAGNGAYIDGFAGSGQVQIRGGLFPGSAARALAAGAFKRFRLYELPGPAQLLQRHLDYYFPARIMRWCVIREGDFNKTVVEDLAAGVIPRDKPCVAFLDPDSTQLDWETVARLAEYKSGGQPPRFCKIELWILFNTYQALMRLLPKIADRSYAASRRAATLDRLMGGRDAWWDLMEDRCSPNLLAGRYAQRLRDHLGYAAVRMHVIRDPDNGRPQYHMIHASDHPAAFSLMKWAEVQASRSDHVKIQFPGLEAGW